MKNRLGSLGRIALAVLLALPLFLSACAPDTVTEAPVVEEPPTEELAEPELETIIPESTRLFDKDALNEFLVDVSDDGEVIVFSEDVLDQKPLEEDDVLAFEPSGWARDGLLRKVIEITRSDGQVEIRTVLATLDEAIEQGEVHDTILLKDAEIRDMELSQGTSIAKVDCSPARDGFNLVINKELEEGVTATGSINVDPSFDFDLVVKRFELQRFAFTNTTELTGKLGLKTEVAHVGLDEKVEIGHITFKPFPIMLGSFPIWVTPKMTFYVGVNGKVSADLTTSVTQDVTVITGLEYANGSFTSINESFGNPTYDLLTLSTSCEASVFVRPQFELLIYGAAGPYVAVNAYVKLEADPSRDPWWEMKGGVRGEVGVDGQHLPVVASVGRHQDVHHLRAARLARDDAVGSHAERFDDQVGHRVGFRVLGPLAGGELHHVLLVHLEFGRILDHDEPVAVAGRVAHGVEQIGLAARRAARDDQIQPALDGHAEELFRQRRDGTQLRQILQRPRHEPVAADGDGDGYIDRQWSHDGVQAAAIPHAGVQLGIGAVEPPAARLTKFATSVAPLNRAVVFSLPRSA